MQAVIIIGDYSHGHAPVGGARDGGVDRVAIQLEGRDIKRIGRCVDGAGQREVQPVSVIGAIDRFIRLIEVDLPTCAQITATEGEVDFTVGGRGWLDCAARGRIAGRPPNVKCAQHEGDDEEQQNSPAD